MMQNSTVVFSDRLERLVLSANHFSGPIPPELLFELTALEELKLNDNLLTGKFPNSESRNAGGGSNLQHLDVADNAIVGLIPAAIYSAWPKLEYLSLARNGLYGRLSELVGNLVGSSSNNKNTMTNLVVAGNQLTGSLPTELGMLTNLVHLDVSSNEFSSSIPSEIGRLTNLVSLELQGNQLSGSVPQELTSILDSIRLLKLERNILQGTLDMFCNNQTDLLISADCGGSDPSMDCPCCVECCDSTLGECRTTVRGMCEQDKRLFEEASSNGDNHWYHEGAGTRCECVGTGEGNNFIVNRLSCTDDACQSCNQDGSRCVMNHEYGFGYNEQGNRTDYSVTFQYSDRDDSDGTTTTTSFTEGDTVVLEKRYVGSDNYNNSITVFVNGLWCNAAGERQCLNNNSWGVDSYYYVDCNSIFLSAGSLDKDLCDDDAAQSAADLTTGPLAVFALQYPPLLQGCQPRFPPV
jgi:hypothetical protein